MKIINKSAMPVWIRLPGIPGAVTLGGSDDSENKVPIGAIDEWLQPGQISREYPEQHREVLLATPGLHEYVAAEAPQPEPERVAEEHPVPGDEEIEVTPTKPKVSPKSKSGKKGRFGRGRSRTK